MSQAGVHTSNRPQSAARLSAASAAKRSPSPARGPSSEAGFSVASSAKSAKSASRNKQRASTYPRKGTTLGDIVLSPEEQQHLEDVLARFDRAKQAEDFRLKSLKDELIKKQKNRIRNAETGGGDGHCYNCGRLFIPLFNAANECYICNHEFCRTCVEKMPNSKNVMCKFCHSESIYRGQLGIWFMEELKVARAEGRVRGVSGPEALRSSLLRIKRQSKADSVLQQGLDGLSLEHRIISDPSNSSPSVQRLTWSDASSANRKTLQLSFAGLPDEVVLQETHIGYVTKEPFAEAFSQQGAHGRPNNSEAGEDFLERDSASENDIHSCSKSVIHIGSQSFLKASTALKEGAFKYHGYPSTVTSLPSLSVEEMNPDTPIQSVSRAMCSYESALCTPEEGNAFRTTLHDDSINDKARVQLANRFHVRRVHFLTSLLRPQPQASPTEDFCACDLLNDYQYTTVLPPETEGTNPLGGSTVSEPSRTEQWVQQATPVPMEKQPKYEKGPVHSTTPQNLPYAEVAHSGPDYQTPSETGENTEALSPMHRRPSLSGSMRDSRRHRDRSRQGMESGDQMAGEPVALSRGQPTHHDLLLSQTVPGGPDYQTPSEAGENTEALSPMHRHPSLSGSMRDSRRHRDRSRQGMTSGNQITGEPVAISRDPGGPDYQTPSEAGENTEALSPMHRHPSLSGSMRDSRRHRDRSRQGMESGNQITGEPVAISRDPGGPDYQTPSEAGENTEALSPMHRHPSLSGSMRDSRRHRDRSRQGMESGNQITGEPVAISRDPGGPDYQTPSEAGENTEALSPMHRHPSLSGSMRDSRRHRDRSRQGMESGNQITGEPVAISRDPGGPDYQTPSEAGENTEALSPMHRHPSLSGSMRDSRRHRDRSRQGMESGNQVANQPHQAGQVQQTADSRLSPDGVPPSGSDYYSPSDVSQNTEGSSPLRRRSSLTGSVADTRRRSRVGSERGGQAVSNVPDREATGIERPPSRPTARAASPAGSEGYAPSSASGGLAAPIYRPGGMGGSLSDLRQTADRPRLSSEAGSVSSLSVASKEPAEGTNSDSAHASPSSSSITRKIEDVPVPEPLQRKSRTLTREEFSEMFGKPLDALAGPDHRRQMTGSLRSLRHVFPVRYRRDERRHGSMLSIYSEKESSYTHGIPVTGDLRLDIQYDKATQTLKIGVKEARDLAIVDKKHQSCNPYVKSYLLPDKTKASKRKTSTKRHTRNPTYEQELKYGIPYGDLLTRSLQIAVWHKPSVGTNLFLGEVIIPFTDFQFDTGPQWYPLSERRQLTVSPQAALQLYRGEILVALKLVPGGLMDTQSELHVWVKSAKGLTTSGSGRSKSVTVDAFAKVNLMPEKDEKTKNKTSIIKKNNNPEWNSTFVYKNLDRNRLRNMGIQVTVWDHGRMTSNDFLGGCRLNSGARTQPWMDATGTEQSVWVAMLDRPQTWFEGLIRLRSIME